MGFGYRIAIWATVLFIGILLVFNGLEAARDAQLFGWPWAPLQPDGENLALRGMMIIAMHLMVVFFINLFRGYDVLTEAIRRRMLMASIYLVTISWTGALLKYFTGSLVETVSTVVGIIGLTGIPLTLYALVVMVRVYRNIEYRLKGEQELADKYYKQLITDPLTGLPNRVLFQDNLTAAIRRAKAENRSVGVLFLDLDRFKYVNDTLGHKMGDNLLLAVVDRLTVRMQAGETLFRLGGDEFIVLITSPGGEVDAVDAATRLLSAMEAPFLLDGHELFISTSIGISLFPEHGTDTETLYKNADMAMYRAKELGRNTYQLFDVILNDHAVERLQLEKDLRKAIEREEFVVYYQPQVEIATGRIIGMEALVRWPHPERGLVSPGQFIPLAEETKLIIPLGELVLRTACLQNKRWQDAGFPPKIVSVNLSAHQFQMANLAQTVQQILDETGLEPKYLDLEITESITMNNIDRAIATMHELSALGIKISIDDFGTGYSSLNYLKKFPIHTLKIDQSFVRDIPTNPDDAAIATAIIAMAHSLHLNVIAEGVETEEQLDFLRQRQCDEMQGYLFSRPVPAAEFEQLISREQQTT